MTFSLKPFKSIGHFFATAIKALAQKGPAEIDKLEATKTVVEKVTTAASAVLGIGTVATSIEDLGYALLGEFAKVLTLGDAAAQAKLADAGVDIAVINEVKSFVTQSQALSSALPALIAGK